MIIIEMPQSLKKYIPPYDHQVVAAFRVMGLMIMLLGFAKIGHATINMILITSGIALFLFTFSLSFLDKNTDLPPQAIIDISTVLWSLPAKNKLQEIVQVKGCKLKVGHLIKILEIEEDYQTTIALAKEQENVNAAIESILK